MYPSNKFRAAIEVINRKRERLVEAMAEDILDQADEFLEGGFLFNEFLETQGTRLHFLSVLMAQLEQSAEALDEARAAAPPPPDHPAPRKRRPRTTKKKAVERQASTEGSTEDL